MTDLSKLAAERCAELANDPSAWDATDFMPGDYGGSTCRALYETVEQAHTLATEALAHPERAAEILAPLILVEPVDADLLIAREIASKARLAAFAVPHYGVPQDTVAGKIARGEWDDHMLVKAALGGIAYVREGGGNG